MTDPKLQKIKEIQLGNPVAQLDSEMVIPMYLRLEEDRSGHPAQLSLALSSYQASRLRAEISDRFAPALDTSLGQKILYRLDRIEKHLERLGQNDQE